MHPKLLGSHKLQSCLLFSVSTWYLVPVCYCWVIVVFITLRTIPDDNSHLVCGWAGNFIATKSPHCLQTWRALTSLWVMMCCWMKFLSCTVMQQQISSTCVIPSFTDTLVSLKFVCMCVSNDEDIYYTLWNTMSCPRRLGVFLIHWWMLQYPKLISFDLSSPSFHFHASKFIQNRLCSRCILTRLVWLFAHACISVL